MTESRIITTPDFKGVIYVPFEEKKDLERKIEFKVTPSVKLEEKPLKKALSKLLKKAKYNTKFLEETVDVNKVKRNIHYRRYGLF